MKDEKWYCDICKKEINLPLIVKLKKHFMGRNHYGNYMGRNHYGNYMGRNRNYEPVYYEICSYEMCESCFKKTYRFIQELKKE